MQRAHEKRYVLRYYQFVPFILLLQALFYLLPRLIWRSFSRHSGIDVRNLMDAAHHLKNVKRFHKEKSIVSYLISILHQYLGDPRKKSKEHHSRIHRYSSGLFHCLLGSSNVFHAYLYFLYLFTKLLSLANTFLQLYAIRLLLEERWTVNETIEGLKKIFSTDAFKTNPFSKYFPKISMCDFRIIEPNSDEGHKYTVQCQLHRSNLLSLLCLLHSLGVLTINVYNEQVFTVLYLWMNFVFLVTLYDFLSWFIFLILPKLRYSFFSERIQTDQSIATIRVTLHAFIYDYLQQDGFFILRLIHSNVGDDVTGTILSHLWKHFQRMDRSATQTNTIANHGATVSLTAAGNPPTDGNRRSIFEFTKTTHL